MRNISFLKLFPKNTLGNRIEHCKLIVRNKSISIAPKNRSKARATTHRVQNFTDYKVVVAEGGDGGQGGLSFLSLPRKEFAGPDGGDGGNGGHVIFEVDPNTRDLTYLSSILKAKNGDNGRSKVQHGKCAEHLYVKVPRGTTIRDAEGEILADLSEHGQTFLAARGGAGGHGNHYYLTNEERAPAIAEEGGVGQRRKLQVELKIMAHAGLVGFPNAGKSTLLQAISRARPKVAAYPFTTLHPSLGMVEYKDSVQIAVADIPGLIEGAHLNYGLGVAFLRHVERCLCLLYVIDLSVPEPWFQLDLLKHELEMYKPGLSQRPHAVIANKLDLTHCQDKLDQLQDRLRMPVFGLSAKYGTGVQELLVHLRALYDRYKDNDG